VIYILGKDSMRLEIERYKGIYARIVTEIPDELIIVFIGLITGVVIGS